MIEEYIKEIKIEKGKTIPLVSDTMFKAVFIKRQGILMKMIRDIFEFNELEKAITIVGYETVPPKNKKKTYRGDILLILSDNSYIAIEVNRNKREEMIDRNMIQLVRIHNQVLESVTKDSELKKYRMRGLNLNLLENPSGDPVENFAICNIKTGKIASLIYSFCNMALEKCYELVYTIDANNLPRSVRWGAILLEKNIDKISKILGDDMLSMEEKKEFLDTIEETNNNNRILQDWMIEENDRWRYEEDMEWSKKDGIEQGEASKTKEVIINMLKKNIDIDTISEVTGKTIKEIEEIEKF